MEIIVSDTNIFIDLHSCGLLDSFFKLPYNVHTTDFVMSELLGRVQKGEACNTFSHHQTHLTANEYSDLYLT